MATNAMFAEIAALAGDPARSSMLHALMDGRALTTTMLSRVAGISPQTASGHLSRLTAVGLLSVEKQGRFHYHRLASASVARMLETMMQVAAELEPDRARLSTERGDAELRKARTCFDHFAGQLGVALADTLVAQGFVELNAEAGMVTEAGLTFLDAAGLDTRPLLSRRTGRQGGLLCRQCFDWSERRSHLGGGLGALICTHSMNNGWTRRLDGTRAVLITPKGEKIFREAFGLKINSRRCT
ncbi:helix-turn-helix transcriptional regulator [Mesorhizobium sp. VK25A]|uniref:Helix-turn-helix transcriptional regulator n=1 Tax=Mesorhizobium vachelliae TaxID=3072309 RepID=A0ABU4ZXH6_9HYPH|nr:MULTISPECIES: helix-turn-helix transcriptional regulator [unclassified Mesorhizobium]MDX8530099.1 helix-turn-helix transcriptional regulator [Mesorhizobium sp. VK25D]MDX8544497.1 helix-turn-helix transcriptional regulator [Mesorhizobium sp. VK25A]